MRNEYYEFIRERGISDILSLISDLSFSSKTKILKNILEKYNANSLNYALNNYKINYIDLKRVDLRRISTTLVYFCKLYKEI